MIDVGKYCKGSREHLCANSNHHRCFEAEQELRNVRIIIRMHED